MVFINQKHRCSIRLPGYDYSQAGWYFITVCTFGRQPLFGRIENSQMELNESGRIVQECLQNITKHFGNVELDYFVIMPNHFHGIVVITRNVGARHAVPLQRHDMFGRPIHGSLSTIIRSFKSVVTKRINQLFNTPANPIWQRNYYEHIIRDEKILDKIRQYIYDNPRRWAADRENPDNWRLK